MKIIDLHGKTITITHLEEAITQAEGFRDLKHDNPEFAKLDEKCHAYWADVYEKLMAFKE